VAYTGNLVDRYNNSITEEGWFMHISASGFTSPFGTFGSFNLFTCVDVVCLVFDPVAAVPINDKFMDPPLPAGSNLSSEREDARRALLCMLQSALLSFALLIFHVSCCLDKKKGAMQRDLT
jgi:hypothetical protein